MTDAATTSASRQIVRAIVLGLLLALLTGVAAGMVAAHRDDGGGAMSAAIIAILGGVALAVLATAVQLLRDVRALLGQIGELPSRERATVRLLGIAVLTGLATGVLGTATSINEQIIFGPPGSMPAWAAIIIALSCATVGPWFTWRWWRAIDEHEKAAYNEGAQIAGHFTLCGGLAWWALARADLVPQPDVMVLIIAMSFVWCAVWLRRKYF